MEGQSGKDNTSAHSFKNTHTHTHTYQSYTHLCEYMLVCDYGYYQLFISDYHQEINRWRGFLIFSLANHTLSLPT